MVKIEVHGGTEAKFLAEFYLPREQADPIKDAQERGRRAFRERLEAFRARETEDGRTLAHLRQRQATFGAKAAEEKKALVKAEAELRAAVAGGKDPGPAQAKVDTAAKQAKMYRGWSVHAEEDAKALAAKIEKEIGAGLVAEREAYFQECEKAVAEFDTKLKQFLAEHASSLAQAQAGREAAASERRGNWPPRAVA
jgi:hypothetical protein